MNLLNFEKISEGKTKIIYQDKNNYSYVFIESKDFITAGNGLKVKKKIIINNYKNYFLER